MDSSSYKHGQAIKRRKRDNLLLLYIAAFLLVLLSVYALESYAGTINFFGQKETSETEGAAASDNEIQSDIEEIEAMQRLNEQERSDSSESNRGSTESNTHNEQSETRSAPASGYYHPRNNANRTQGAQNGLQKEINNQRKQLDESAECLAAAC